MTDSPSALYRFPPKVLRDICRELLAIPRGGSPTVAALAVTARLFHEPALDVLWCTIPDIAVLFYTLPDELYHTARVAKEGRVLNGYKRFRFNDDIPNGTPEESQLERFFAYARRVKVLDSATNFFISAGEINAAPGTCGILAKVLGARSLLPNVHAINYIRSEATSMNVFSCFDILFGPKLERLRIHSYDYSDPTYEAQPPFIDKYEGVVTQMLKNLKVVSPLLRDVDVRLSLGTAPVGLTMANTVCGLKHLELLRLGSCDLHLTPAAFVHLALLPKLGTLTFRMPDSEADWAADLTSLAETGDRGCRFFPVLRDLSITAPTFALPTKLLRFVGSQCLTRIIIAATKAVPRDEIDPLVLAVAALQSSGSLHQIFLHAFEDLPDPAEANTTTGHIRAPRPIGRAALEPLLVLRSLKDLRVKFRFPFDIDDALLEDCGKAWPKLRELAFGCDSTWGILTDADFDSEGDDDTALVPGARAYGDNVPLARRLPAGLEVVNDLLAQDVQGSPGRWRRPRATLFGLVALVRLCPELTTLQVEVSAIFGPAFVPPALLEARSVLQPPSFLEELSVGLAPIDDPYAVAAFLSDVFPHLCDLSSSWWEFAEKIRGEEVDEVDDDDDGDVVPESWWSVARLCQKRWQKVSELIPGFTDVRQQERRWRRKGSGTIEGDVGDVDTGELM